MSEDKVIELGRIEFVTTGREPFQLVLCTVDGTVYAKVFDADGRELCHVYSLDVS